MHAFSYSCPFHATFQELIVMHSSYAGCIYTTFPAFCINVWTAEKAFTCRTVAVLMFANSKLWSFLQLFSNNAINEN